VNLIPDVSILMQTVVEVASRVEDGEVIRVVLAPWIDLVEALLKDPSLPYQVDPRQLEAIVAAGWDRIGASEVILTPRSGDLGRDVIATFDGVGIFRSIGAIRIIDQVKRNAPTNLVTADDARALITVMNSDLACKGFLTTTGDFAPRIREDRHLKPYIGSRLELVNGTDLKARWAELVKLKR
jgi:restriction system protein